MKQSALAIGGIVFGAVCALGVGCESGNKLNVLLEEGSTAVHVNLPAVPQLPPPPPVNHSEGVFTLYGVRHQAARDAANIWSKVQKVHGFIVSVYVARNERGQNCTERDRCLEERPHIFIADSRTERDPERMLQVTGYATFQREIDEARENHRRNRPVPAAQQAMITAGLARPVPFDFDEGAEVIVQVGGNALALFVGALLDAQRRELGIVAFDLGARLGDARFKLGPVDFGGLQRTPEQQQQPRADDQQQQRRENAPRVDSQRPQEA
jgi:hypothetical protein